MKKQERKLTMDYRTMVNPTYLTAKSTLFMLAGMGNDDAKRVIAALGTQDILTQRDSKKQGSALPETEVKALMTGASLAIKSRYEALSRLIRTEGTKGLMDIACVPSAAMTLFASSFPIPASMKSVLFAVR